MPMLPYLRGSLLPRMCLIAVALFSACSVAGGFVSSDVTTVTCHPSLSLSSSAAVAALSALSARRKTLYEILGASPGESQESLRRRYSELAKKTHPDAAVSGGGEVGRNVDTSDFANIAAAWSVLGDPKERMKYDRELKAKEFTDSVERLVDTGIRNTIPFLRKTANNTQAAMEKSAEIATDVQHRMREMNERMEMSRKIFDVEKAKRDIEQRALRQQKQSQQVQKEIDTLDDTRLNELIGNSSITAAKAARLLDGFLPKSEQTQAHRSVISDLKESERRLGEKRMGAKESGNNLVKSQQQVMSAENSVVKSQQQVVSAENSVKEAELRLDEAKKMLMQAKSDVEDSKKAAATAEQKEKAAQAEVVKASSSLSQQMEKARATLRTTESQVLEKKAVFLKGERVRLQSESNELSLQAKKLGVEIENLKKEEEEIRRRQMGS